MSRKRIFFFVCFLFQQQQQQQVSFRFPSVDGCPPPSYIVIPSPPSIMLCDGSGSGDYKIRSRHFLSAAFKRAEKVLKVSQKKSCSSMLGELVSNFSHVTRRASAFHVTK